MCGADTGTWLIGWGGARGDLHAMQHTLMALMDLSLPAPLAWLVACLQKRRAKQAAHTREVERLLAYRRQLYQAMRVRRSVALLLSGAGAACLGCLLGCLLRCLLGCRWLVLPAHRPAAGFWCMH